MDLPRRERRLSSETIENSILNQNISSLIILFFCVPLPLATLLPHCWDLALLILHNWAFAPYFGVSRIYMRTYDYYVNIVMLLFSVSNDVCMGHNAKDLWYTQYTPTSLDSSGPTIMIGPVRKTGVTKGPNKE